MRKIGTGQPRPDSNTKAGNLNIPTIFCRLTARNNNLYSWGIYLASLTFAEIFYSGMIYLTRLEHFNAAHKLFNPGWSRQQNEAVFGKCANENWHGHNYELYVTIKGEPDPDTGFVLDVKKLSGIIKEHILEKLDHLNLNEDVDFMKGKMCSTENLAIAIWEQLELFLPPAVQLHAVKLYETPSIFVEYYGR